VLIETRMLLPYSDMLTNSGCKIVVMDRAPDLPWTVTCFWDLLDNASDQDNDVELDTQNHIAVLRFSGGTSGRSKCAQYTVDNLLACRDNGFLNTDFNYGETTRFLTFTPISHAPAMIFIPTLFAGGTTYTLNMPDLVDWAQVVQAERITHALFVPTLLYRMLEMQLAQTYDLSSLTTIGYGAFPIVPSAVRGCKQDHEIGSEAALKRLGSAGRVLPDVELIIADDAGTPLPIGVTGEIWLRTRATIAGYYGNPVDTAADFENGFWKSGDLGYLDEHGYLFIVDRKKDMIITGGFNVYAVEVEAALSEHPAVLLSAAVGVPDAEWGEAIHADVVLRGGQVVSENELITHANAVLGSYKAPKTIRFVEQLPLSPVGKVLRRAVREPYWVGQQRLL
jgi:acyl-CoA synthetase (AMP-forming)/AMP-acid ligase II